MEAEFQFEDDRAIVTELLLEHLVRTLPPTKHSQEYVGEWKTNAWSVERLRPFFAGTGELPGFESGIGIKRFESSVPSNLQEAVESTLRDQALRLAGSTQPAGQLGPRLAAPRLTRSRAVDEGRPTPPLIAPTVMASPT